MPVPVPQRVEEVMEVVKVTLQMTNKVPRIQCIDEIWGACAGTDAGTGGLEGAEERGGPANPRQ